MLLRQANILIADGDPEARTEVAQALRSLGHNVVGEADSGAQALVLARSLRPDAALVSLALSNPAGTDVVRTLSEERIAPALVLIAENETLPDEIVGRLETAGAMGVLGNLPRLTELGPALSIIITRWRRLVELEDEVRILNERMEARRLVGRAKAILMERFNLQEREAFRRIQAQSVTLNKPVHEIARAIITASEIPA